ncbi:MAG: hypothetical protein AAGE59_13850 [Cyanobacteria bacterium P01_F01_bin.86]
MDVGLSCNASAFQFVFKSFIEANAGDFMCDKRHPSSFFVAVFFSLLDRKTEIFYAEIRLLTTILYELEIASCP